jgi:hypothetical protein
MVKEGTLPSAHAHIARSGRHWKLHAATFRFAADKFYEHMPFDEYSAREDVRSHCILMYHFLIGLSLEDLLKGLLIAAEPDLVIKTTNKPESGSLHTYVLDTRLQTHDLLTLAGMVTRNSRYSLTFSRAERELLRRLSHIVKWHGRYPIVLTPKEQSSLYFRPVGDRATFEGLWEQLTAALDDFVERDE